MSAATRANCPWSTRRGPESAPTWLDVRHCGGARIPRIAIVFEFPTLNGGERSMLAVTDRLAGRGIEFAAVAPPEGRLADALRQRNLPLIPLLIRDEQGVRLPEPEARQRLLAAVQAASPELVHANSLAMGRLTGGIAAELPCPTVAHLRDILNLSRRAVEQLNRNRLLIAVSQAARDHHVAQGVAPDRVRVLYNGVDCERFRPRENTGWLKRELGVSGDAFLILSVGQIGFRKGLDVLARAAILLRDRLPDVHYVLVGERNSTKQESIRHERDVVAMFREAAREPEPAACRRTSGRMSGNELSAWVPDRLHMLGYRDDVPRIMNEADLLVHASHQEPLGRVLLEAAASGLPVVATAVGGTPEIFTDGESARLVPARRPESLAEAVIELRANPEKRSRFAAAARRRMQACFDIDRAAAELAATWDELLRPDATARGKPRR